MRYLTIITLTIAIVACNNEGSESIKNNKIKSEMRLIENSEIKEISERLKEGMIEFIEPGETAYSKTDVETCMNLISDYLNKVENASSKDETMKIVEKTVLALNDLNEKCEYELIETDQREDIAEILILAGNLKGFNSRDEDITEDWREW